MTNALASNDNMTAEVRTRISPDLKHQATEVLSHCGLNVSDAVRLFLKQVVTQGGIPFEVKAPNATTIAAMKESRKLSGTQGQSLQSLVDALEKRRK